MRYYKNIVDGYLYSLEKRETIASGIEITEAEYDHIKSIIDNRPTAPDGYGYRLTAELEWELYELPDEEELDAEISEAEALEILLGGAV